jgi:arylsulfatase A-like enzyme
VVYVDNLGFGDTGVHGHAVVQTSNIDRLAAEGAGIQSAIGHEKAVLLSSI